MGAIQVVAIVLGVIVLAWVVLRLAGRGGGSSPTTARSYRPAPGLTPDVAAKARALSLAGKKIQAIKLVREHTGMGLAEAKDAVEALERQPLAAAGPAAAAAAGAVATSPALNELELEGVRALVAEGQTIEAIKLVRERTGLGLAEAKALVERLGEG